ncbi:hypothetical protein A6U84_21295 [Agrobacterium sp. 13-2099-1-2]|uniref:hypothetical protein n=1 Tax=Agrobacterium sp. 13-2099-1-2 TaxID=1841651 RepID=UPI00080FDEBD|nr:hypothetical protein [Agrobacterium sp. 13-2099-1-2]UZX44589.1 hypothetical protein A6U84_21295 [Agrobacterium sp. 13-2099-1-2]
MALLAKAINAKFDDISGFQGDGGFISAEAWQREQRSWSAEIDMEYRIFFERRVWRLLVFLA